MTRGRKPIPTRIKGLRGKPGKRRLLDNEPQYDVGIPQAPEHLDAAGLDEWNRITAQMEINQTIANVDMAIVALYCEAWSEWCEITRLLKDQDIIKQYSSGAEYVNLLIGQRRSVRNEIRVYAAELGITPSSRVRVRTVGKIEKPGNPNDARERLRKAFGKAKEPVLK